jgi:hypothetical protein
VSEGTRRRDAERHLPRVEDHPVTRKQRRAVAVGADFTRAVTRTEALRCRNRT